jgi:hypothetical protein
MNAAELRSAAIVHFEREGYAAAEDAKIKLPLLLSNGSQRWGLALCAEHPDALAYLGGFEAAMQAIIEAAQLQRADLKLGIALDFASTAGGQDRSYRRALKKYSNSIVFEDLNLSLFLVRAAHEVLTLNPPDVNAFLRDLNRFIADNR